MKATATLLFIFLFFVGTILAQPHDTSTTAYNSNEDNTNKHVDTINLLFNYYDSLGLICLETGSLEKADSLLKLGLKFKTQILDKNDLKIAFSYQKIGNVKIKQKDYNSALTNYLKALEIREFSLPANDSITLILYNNIALLYRDIGDIKNTIHYFNKLLQTKLQFNEEEGLDILYARLGFYYNKNKEYFNAIEAYQKSITLFSKSLNPNLKDLRFVNFELGLIFQNEHQYDLAIESFLNALTISFNIDADNLLYIADSYTNLGISFEAKGDFKNALIYFDKALTANLNHFGEGHFELAKPYNNLGALKQRMGDLGMAEPYLYKAMQIRRQHSKKPNKTLALSINNYGTVNYSLSLFDKALSYFLEAEQMYLSINSQEKEDIAYCYHYLAVIYCKKEMYDSAKIYNDKALEIRLELYPENHINVADSYNNAGVILSEMGEIDSALNLTKKAYLIMVELLNKNDSRIFFSLQNLANQYEKNGQEEIADSIWKIIVPNLESHILKNYLHMPTHQRLNYLNVVHNINSNFFAFATKYNSNEIKALATNFLLSTKSLSLDLSASTERIVKNIDDPKLSKLNQKVQNLTDSIANLKQIAMYEGTKENDQILALTEKRDLVSMELYEYPAIKSKLMVSKINWQDIQAKLSSSEVAIEFLKTYDKETNKQDSSWIYYAIIIKKDQDFPQFVKTTNDATLKQFLKVEKAHCPVYLESRRQRNQLYEKLWKNMEPHLQNVKTVHLSPTGFLYNLSFGSLQNDQFKYLGDQFEFHYYTSLRNLKNIYSSDQTYKNILLLGDITYGSGDNFNLKEHETIAYLDNSLGQIKRNGIKPLPNTRIEIDTIEKISLKAGLGTHLFTGADASEENLNQYLKGNSPNILHIATHGVAATSKINEQEGQYISSEDPLQKSALLLSGSNEVWLKNERIKNDSKDGLLTALEVTNLNLQNTDLVVLSACKTGLGEGYSSEGIFGLQRAFKIAGVKAVIASLWDVNDEATKELMASFYDYLINQKQAPGVALRNAKMQLKDAGYEPADWAGFILIE